MKNASYLLVAYPYGGSAPFHAGLRLTVCRPLQSRILLGNF